jgi:hypothetical protein
MSYWNPAARLAQMQEAKRLHEWKNRSPDEKRAAILWSGLVPKETRQAMASLTEVGKKPPGQQRLLNDSERGAVSPLGGTAARTGRR